MNCIRYALIVTAVTMFLSCESFLDRPPLDTIGNDSYWNTVEDLERYVLKYYQSFNSHASGNGAVMAMEDNGSDNLINVSVNPWMNGERSLSTGRWIGKWSNIRSINIFFDNYNKVQGEPGSYSHIVGEAHFFKAWFYFGLLKQYGALPWYTSSLEPFSDELYRPRDDRSLVVDSILDHLDNAINLLDGRSIVGNNRLNKETALAFKTRVALYEGTWQKYHANTPFGSNSANPTKYFQACVEAAEELFSGDYRTGIYSTGNPSEDYYTLFGMDNMGSVDEILLYRAYNKDIGRGNSVQHYTTSATETDYMAVTWSLVSSYLSKDGLEIDYTQMASQYKGGSFLTKLAELSDPRLHATIWTPGDLRVAVTNQTFSKPNIDRTGKELCSTGFQVKKFSNPNSPAAGVPCCGHSETGYILFRFAETLLNYAEAKYELDGTVAVNELNILRHRVGMPDFNENIAERLDPADYGYPVSDALYEIRRERRVELALEGFREDDYKRWASHTLFDGQRPLGYPFEPSEFPSFSPFLNEDGLIDPFQNILPNGYQFRADRDYLMDIPLDELTLNPNLEQNPGW